MRAAVVKAARAPDTERQKSPNACVRIYRALTTQMDHHVMKNRDDMNAVVEGLQRKHGLLAAFLEATLQRRAAVGEISEPINVEAHQQTAPAPDSTVVPFAFRRANLVRASR